MPNAVGYGRGIRARRARRGLLAGAGALLLTAAASACAAESVPVEPSGASQPPQASEPSAEPWERFSDPRFPQSFELPPGWAAVERPSAYSEEGPYQFEIRDADGAVQLHLLTGVQGMGGACTGELPVLAIEELDSEPVELPGYVPAGASPGSTATAIDLVPPRVVFRASQLDDRVLTSLSLSDDEPVDTCMYYNVLHSEPGPMAFADAVQVDSSNPNPAPPRTFATMEEARAFTETEEYATLARILGSLHLQ